MFKTDGLTPMQKGRLDAALDRKYRYRDGVRTLRQNLEQLAVSGTLSKKETDRSLDFNRTHFNRLNGREQQAYLDRLEAKRYYWISADGGETSTAVPKIVYDAIDLEK